MSDLKNTLAARGKDYGSFQDKAIFIQNAKYMMRSTPMWDFMDDDQREALEMIQHKISRILFGNPSVADTWHDVAGYAKLVEDRLNGVDSNAPVGAVEPYGIEAGAVGKAAAVPTQGFPDYEVYMYGNLGVSRSFGGNE